MLLPKTPVEKKMTFYIKNSWKFTQHQPLLLFGKDRRGSERHTVEHAKKSEHPPVYEIPQRRQVTSTNKKIITRRHKLS